MTDSEKPLRDISSDLGRRTPERAPKPGGGAFAWDEVAFLAEGLAFGPRALRAATAKVTERYNLGPRGAWILNVISHGVAYPLELASVFCVGRSLITAELSRLTEAGLVNAKAPPARPSLSALRRVIRFIFVSIRRSSDRNSRIRGPGTVPGRLHWQPPHRGRSASPHA